jgi:hypothetical protein
MKPGRFYAYYKPSHINGFSQFMSHDINWDFIQAFEGHCRDELSFNAESTLKKSDIVTHSLANQVFSQVFQRETKNVNFSMNPNMQRFKRILRDPKPTKEQKPVLFVYQPEVLSMIPNVDEINDALKEHQETFDIYYCKDEKVVKNLFYTRKLPDLMPFVMIIDPQQRIALREGRRKNGDKLQPKEERPLEEGSYPFKTQGYIFLNSIKADLNKFIQQFLDDEQ